MIFAGGDVSRPEGEQDAFDPGVGGGADDETALALDGVGIEDVVEPAAIARRVVTE